MFISALRIRNYKSFRDSDWLSFGPTFTVIVGQNNVGKTALLEAFRMRENAHNPFRGLSLPRGRAPNPASRFDVKLRLPGAELKDIFLASGSSHFIAIPDEARPNPQSFLDKLFSDRELELEIFASPGASIQSERNPCHGLFERGQNNTVTQAFPSPDRTTIVGSGFLGAADGLLGLLENAMPRLVYVFKAERLNIGTHQSQDTEVLAPNASNLPAVLFKLQSNPWRWNRYNEHVRTIFPAIKRVVVGPVAGANGQLAISLWSIDLDTERDDLAIRLEESGTGVGQVLAILYVAMSRERNVIVIDEPNSFLHPGASKKLMQILKRYGSNQYVISTHSPEIIATIKPEIVHLLQWSDQESMVTQLDSRSLADMNRILTDVGVELTDVFGADRVIWVEGPTEQKCFPLIAAALPGGLPLGTVFVPLRNTGDFDAKAVSAKAVWEIYERLTSGPALLPPALAFSFDRENRSEIDIKDMQRRSDGRAHFLPRATYENFLLHPPAIQAVLANDYERYEMGEVPGAESIENWIEESGSLYGARTEGGPLIEDRSWLASCNAPKLLGDLFSSLSDQRLSYRKLTHSIALTEWLLKNAPEKLSELSSHITDIVGQ